MRLVKFVHQFGLCATEQIHQFQRRGLPDCGGHSNPRSHRLQSLRIQVGLFVWATSAKTFVALTLGGRLVFGIAQSVRRPQIQESLMPCLEHEYPPKHIGAVSPASLMFVPQATHFADIKKTIVSQARFLQLSFAPVAQWTTKPALHRSVETHLGSLEKLRRESPF